MVVVDVVAVLALLAAFLVGVQRGLFANIGVILGVVAGGVAAYALTPLVLPLVTEPRWRGLAATVLVVLLLAAGVAIGATIGHLVRSGVDRTPLRGVERLLGGVATLVVAALGLSFAASTVTLTGSPALSAAVASSRVVQVIDRLTPAPVAAGISQLRAALLEDGIPRFGSLLLPGTVAPVDPLALDDPELAAAAASVARVSGTAYACGRSLTGSGFALSPDRIVTNAHVVAGVDSPLVELPGGIAAEGRVVYFDPAADLAVVAVDGLNAVPLRLADDLAVGSAAAVQGYPYGGPLSTVDAQVLSRGLVAVPDIYGADAAPREVYALATDVRPGNSGGPLLAGDGTVAGVVFARGEDDAARGYAVTEDVLQPLAEVAAGFSAVVSTGPCTG